MEVIIPDITDLTVYFCCIKQLLVLLEILLYVKLIVVIYNIMGAQILLSG